MSKVIVYSTPKCVQCDATKRLLKKLEVEFESVDLSQNEDAKNKLMSEGFKQAPIVDWNGEKWSGFRPDFINKKVGK